MSWLVYILRACHGGFFVLAHVAVALRPASSLKFLPYNICNIAGHIRVPCDIFTHVVILLNLLPVTHARPDFFFFCNS
jgi:hypothetical protein